MKNPYLAFSGLKVMDIVMPVALVLLSYEIGEHLLHLFTPITESRFLHVLTDSALGLFAAGLLAWWLIIRKASVSFTKSLTLIPDERMSQRTEWFVNFRWVAIIGASMAVYLCTHVLELLPDHVDAPLWAGIGILLVMNFVFIQFKTRIRKIRVFLLWQIVLDIGILTWLLHFSGGIGNPFLIFYVFYVILAGVLLSRSQVRVVTGFTVGFFLFLVFGEYSGILEHHFLLFSPGEYENEALLHPAQNLQFVLKMSGSFIILFIGTSYYITVIMDQFRKSQEYLLRVERLTTLGQLVAYVTHEVNNPIGIISTRAKLVKSRLEQEPVNSFLSESIEIIDRQADRVGEVVKNLLGFSKFNSSNKTSVDINQVLSETLESLRERVQKGGIRLNCSFARELPWVHANENNLIQVFLNLIANAIDAMPNGGQLKIETRSFHGSVETTISDTGEGIAQENLGKIFEPFFTTKQCGTGLGLPISLALIRSLSGEIKVDSGKDSGSSFCVRLPVESKELESK